MIKETRINIRNYLQAIVSIAYAGHPDGREARLVMIERYAKAALEEIEKVDAGKVSAKGSSAWLPAASETSGD